MISLGIESTAHTAGVGIVDSDGRIMANVSSAIRSDLGGFRPGEAAEHHSRVIPDLVREALREAGLTFGEVDLVAFSRGPGMGQPLQVGALAARALALRGGKPLVGVNHPIAHIEIGRLATGADDPLVVYVAGGNTQILVEAGGRVRVLGETLDIGLGNAQEKLGRKLGLGFPAGPKLDSIEGEWVDLPYTVKGMDMAFSGLVTEAERRIRQGVRPEDVAWSFVEVAFSMLVEVTERALAATGRGEVLIVGGVGASPRLREKMEIMCEERGAELRVTPPELCRDNGAMVAWAGILALAQFGETEVGESRVLPDWRVDELEWRFLRKDELRALLEGRSRRG